MTPRSIASRIGLRAVLALVFSAAVTFAAPEIKFPPGLDWSNASPEQIREAVFAAVKENPDNAIEIVQAAMENVQNTGRFPNAGAGDNKQVIDPDDGIVTLPEVAEQIARGAIQANPAMAAMITQAVNNAVASAPITQQGATQTTDGGGTDGGGGTSGGGVPPALPGGFGGGGGGGTSGGGSIYSN